MDEQSRQDQADRTRGEAPEGQDAAVGKEATGQQGPASHEKPPEREGAEQVRAPEGASRPKSAASIIAWHWYHVMMALVMALVGAAIVGIALILPMETEPAPEPVGHAEPTGQADPAGPTPQKQDEDKKPKRRDKDSAYDGPTNHELKGNAAEAVREFDSYDSLIQAIEAFEGEGYDLSFSLLDLASDKRLDYNADEPHYPASTIKAPYVTSVYEKLVEPGIVSLGAVEPLATDIILDSDNEAYTELHDTYGNEAYGVWLEDAGVDTRDFDYEGWNYPMTSAKQLMLMWQQIHHYASGTSEGAKSLANLLANRETSPLRKALGSRYETWGKAGWFDEYGDFGSMPTTADAGVVFSKTGDYIVVVMTDAPDQEDELVPLFIALDMTHDAMV